MQWKKNQWVRCDFGIPMHGNESIKAYSYYKINKINEKKGVFTIWHPSNTIFSIDDGAIVKYGEKQPDFAKVTPLSPEDAKYVEEYLQDYPGAIMIRAKEDTELGTGVSF